MTRREALLSAGLIALVALVVRVWAATIVTFPRPEDTAYYVGVARNLLDGRGLVSDAIWSFGTPPLVFPRPAFEVWLPLPTFLAAVPMAILGGTFAAAQWSSILVGTIVAVLAWRLGADVAAARGLPVGRARTLALATGLGTAVYLPLVLFSALPDSTMLFAALVLGATLLMARIRREAGAAPIRRLADPRLLGLGVLLGLAALTRNEAAWLAIIWVGVAWTMARARGGTRSATLETWVRLVAPVAAVSILIFAPWAVRDWIVFGSPLPGQALSNALSLDGRDIFAWSETPTLERYLAAGPATLLGLRWTAFVHDLWSVLLVTGVPVSLVGLVGIGGLRRDAAVRPLLVFSLVVFVVTTLVFPVSTTWGTFLHAAGAIHVLVVLGAATALDAMLAAIGRRRGWTRPTAWLGGALLVVSGALFCATLLPSFGAGGRETADRYAALPAALEAAGVTLERDGAPVITDFPIWLAEETGANALALPDESPESVLALARAFPGTSLVIVDAGNDGVWPEVAETDATGRRCFEPVRFTVLIGDDPLGVDLPTDIRVYRIVCP